MPTSDVHADATRKRLCHLAELRRRTEASEQAIQSAAHAEMDRLQSDQVQLAPRVYLEAGAAATYQRNILHIGRLGLVLGRGA